jgi:hypothetical protein
MGDDPARAPTTAAVPADAATGVGGRLLPAVAGLVVAGGAALALDAGWRDHLVAWALVQGAAAALAARVAGAPWWWQAIHAAFLPLAAVALRFAVAPGWYLAAFVALLAVFWRTDTSRVPLFLSNAATAAELVRLLPRHPCRVVDLGCGHGGLLRRVARARPDCRLTGVEHAPLPWLWARVAAFATPNLALRLGDLWTSDLSGVDVLYVFLSPVPMPRLWQKAAAEMSAGALVVSNSFPVPGVAPDAVVAVADRRQTQLYCYRLRGPAAG